ncbi:Holliday junction resolvase RuvX [[Mycoplasma] falconis]|uniref:Putative pre-16S rRNA nuclease n=1 Tax=[Mycoplasma] falconis TaxID=92403 RepID=A0A501XAH1_9BACT|nr:Holliday junction resolvase RuvX [[Mycoplasma] falconis]TPE57530.1 Holliday junction resolvase RuvX [[Mycoplasma] falconis]
MRKLALDLGSKSCGFAISDINGIIATGLENFMFEEWHFIKAIRKTKEYIEQYNNEIDTIVLGYPLRMDLSKSPRTIMVEKFAQRLKEHINLPIVFQDERQSTKFAEDILAQAGFNKTRRKTKKDSLAAQIILEDYLRRQHGKENI